MTTTESRKMLLASFLVALFFGVPILGIVTSEINSDQENVLSLDLDEKQFSNHQTNFTLGWDYAGQIINETVEKRVLDIDHFPNGDLAVLIQSERVGCGLQNQIMSDTFSNLLLRIQPDGTCIDGVSISGPANWRVGSLSVSQSGEIWLLGQTSNGIFINNQTVMNIDQSVRKNFVLTLNSNFTFKFVTVINSDASTLSNGLHNLWFTEELNNGDFAVTVRGGESYEVWNQSCNALKGCVYIFDNSNGTIKSSHTIPSNDGALGFGTLASKIIFHGTKWLYFTSGGFLNEYDSINESVRVVVGDNLIISSSQITRISELNAFTFLDEHIYLQYFDDSLGCSLPNTTNNAIIAFAAIKINITSGLCSLAAPVVYGWGGIMARVVDNTPNEIYFSGRLEGNASFLNGTELVSLGQSPNMFLAVLSLTSSSWVWAEEAGGTFFNEIEDISISNDGLIALSGGHTTDYYGPHFFNASPRQYQGGVLLLSEDLDLDGYGSISDLDDDGDNWSDEDEISCQSNPFDSSSMPPDSDGDGICDDNDLDNDNDGYNDTNDEFPLDPTEWADNDDDGIGNNADLDDDNDGWSDINEIDCGDSDPLNGTSTPADYDEDGICDTLDEDDDSDGYLDDLDAFPLDPNEWDDTDNDGIGNNADLDDDNDGWSDSDESSCGTDSLNSSSTPTDTDNDGICNYLDSDDDNDTYPDSNDDFPLDECAVLDTDGDGIPDWLILNCNTNLSEDIDDDNDGYNDTNDSHPLDPSEWFDTDNDGIGDNADTDDDGDNVPDQFDVFPLDPTEWMDTDGDGIGNNADTDNDDDGVLDTNDDFPNDANETVDTDGDGIGNNADDDDDGDGYLDIYDQFPLDSTEWFDTDLDGIGNNADPDDDGDGWTDNDEFICGSDELDANDVPDDSDGDGICDSEDDDSTGLAVIVDVVSNPLVVGLFLLIGAIIIVTLFLQSRNQSSRINELEGMIGNKTIIEDDELSND